MIDLYTWTTPNGRKASIMLEEVGLDYTEFPIDIRKGDQKTPDYLAMNPNGKIPVIVDHDGPGGGDYVVFESGAILMYLAEKTGSDLLPAEPRARMDTIQWLMFQMGGIGPMLGQAHVFLFKPKEVVPFAQKRYHDETLRLYGVMNGRLGQCEYLAGDAYSIADVATYPWISRHTHHDVKLEDFPNVLRWYDSVGARPAVQRGMRTLGKAPDA